MLRIFSGLVGAVTVSIVAVALAQSGLPPFEMDGPWKDDTNISAALMFGPDRLIVGSDEVGFLQIGRNTPEAPHRFVANGIIRLNDASPNGSEIEIDVEALASDGTFMYALGSHSQTRTRSDRHKRTYAENRQNLLEETRFFERERLYRFRLNKEAGLIEAPSSITLRAAIEQQAILKPFLNVSSKENGVDIEGLAAHEGYLYAGFRGPVLRHGYTPVLRFKFETPETATVLLVPLDGRGVRDLVRVANGFLVLAGPVGDSDQSHRLYWWNGKDCVAGSGGPGGRLSFLGDVAADPAGKAEALLLDRETPNAYDLVLFFDSLTNGAPQRLRIDKGSPQPITAATTLCGRGSSAATH